MSSPLLKKEKTKKEPFKKLKVDRWVNQNTTAEVSVKLSTVSLGSGHRATPEPMTRYDQKNLNFRDWLFRLFFITSRSRSDSKLKLIWTRSSQKKTLYGNKGDNKWSGDGDEKARVTKREQRSLRIWTRRTEIGQASGDNLDGQTRNPSETAAVSQQAILTRP